MTSWGRAGEVIRFTLIVRGNSSSIAPPSPPAFRVISMSDYDSPWKEALDRFFRWFVECFFPEIAAQIDWAADHEALDQELQKLAPSGEVGRRYTDKLVRVARKAEAEPALIHVEVQAREEADFPRRLYVYHYRAEDRYNLAVVSLAVLGDDNPAWRPNCYEFRLWGCEKTFTFRWSNCSTTPARKRSWRAMPTRSPYWC